MNNDTKSSLLPSSSNIRSESMMMKPPQQPGCSTMKPTAPGGYRNKVHLKPGHSALDWSEKLLAEGKNGKLVTGIDLLLQDPAFIEINHPESINQLRQGVPPYMIKPLLNLNKEIVQRHQINRDDFWCVIKGKVYCLTKYFDFHPGGAEILINASRNNVDITKLFDNYHRWVNAERILGPCIIGIYRT